MTVAATGANRVVRNYTHKFPSLAGRAEAPTRGVIAHLQAGRHREAVSLAFRSPCSFSFSLYAALFRVCGSNLTKLEVQKVNSHLTTHCPLPPTFVLNRAVEAYSKCGCLDGARELFDEMRQRDGGSWNSMIAAYTKGGDPEKALLLFSRMAATHEVRANEVTFASVLGSCAALLALFVTRQIHGLLIKCGFSGNVILESSLVDVYGKCGVMGDSRKVFDEMPVRNSVSWNVMVRRYLQAGYFMEAVEIFSRMIRQGVTPMNHTFSTVLIACSSFSAHREGTQIHGFALKTGMLDDEVLSSSLVTMYVKFHDMREALIVCDGHGYENFIPWTSVVSGYATVGRTREAEEIFDRMPNKSIVSWNAMLAGYLQVSKHEEAIDFIFQMLKTVPSIDNVTLSLLLNACAGLSNVRLGKQAHAYVYRRSFFLYPLVSNAVLDMYGKCGYLRNATLCFGEMAYMRDIVSWNSLLSAYVNHGLSEKAISIFSELTREATPSGFSLGTLLAACANTFALNEGRQIHGFLLRNHYNETDVVIRGSLVDMYCKCRRLEYALRVFWNEGRDLVLCNSMILGCCHWGRGLDVIRIFDSMRRERISPDHITFKGVLMGCVFEGLVDLGEGYFKSMSEVYSVIPRIEHYECMIDLYSFNGLLHSLDKFVKKMPIDPSLPILMRVMDVSRKYGFSELGRWAAERVGLFHV